MKAINCACPRCGKQTTEYDEDKWTCLHCGNKFVIKPEEPSTIVNSTLNVNGEALYDLDVAGKAAHVLMSKTVTESYMGNQSWKVVAIGLGHLFILGLISRLLSYLGVDMESDMAWSIVLWVALILIAATWLSALYYRQERNCQVPSHWEGRCPCCGMAHHDLRDGLKHCIECGKQFVVTQGASWRLRR